MRILLVTDWPETDGGLEIHLEAVAAGLRSRGHDVWLLSSDAGRGRKVADVVVRAPRTVVGRAIFQVANPFAAHGAKRAVERLRPDVAHVSMFEMTLSPSVLTALAPVPYVVDIAYYKPICPLGTKLLRSGIVCADPAGLICRRRGCVPVGDGLREVVRYRRIGRGIERASAVLTCSEWMCAVLARDGLAAEALPPPVWPETCNPRPRTVDPVVVYVGRLAPEKGVNILLTALAGLRRDGLNVRLRVVGDGPQRLELEALAEGLALGDAVEWWGRVPHRVVPDAIADSWAVVAPALWAEPLGLSVVEATLQRIPVIATAHGGHLETVVDGVTGLLVPPGDAIALGDALRRLLRGEVADRIPEAAVDALARRHDPVDYLDRLENTLARAARRGVRPESE